VKIPSEPEIKKSIDYIVDKGLKTEESFYNYLKNMIQNIGFKFLFNDFGELIFAVSLIIFIQLNSGYFFLNSANSLKIQDIYFYLFIWSPIVFFVQMVISLNYSKYNGTFLIEMVCKYNIYQIIGLKMFVFSTVSILINTLNVYYISVMNSEIVFIKVLMISISSLFIFSLLFLYAMLKGTHKLTKYVVFICWIVIISVLKILFREYLFNVLDNIPIYIYAGVILVTLAVYISNLKKIIYLNNKRSIV
jgi:hypothetical protein